MRSFSWGFALGLIALLGTAGYAAPTGNNVVIGYYFLSPEQINAYDEKDPKVVPFPISRITPEKAKMLTHINFSFLDINADGECCWDPKVNQDKAKKVTGKLADLRKHNPKLRIMYSIGGWYYSNDMGPSVQHYRKAVATPEARAKLARSCVKIAKDYGFDGIDIDWEYPRVEDSGNFVAALKEIRTLLTRENAARGEKPYQLTIAAAGGAFFLSRYYDKVVPLVAELDYINLMTYDLAGPWERITNHHAALFGDPAAPKFYNALRDANDGLPWEEKVKRYPSPFALTADAAVQQHIVAGVPPEKIVMGVPFYGRAFKEVAGDRGQYSNHSTPGGDPYQGDATWLVGCKEVIELKEPRLATYAQIKQMIKGDFGYERHWNEMTKTPWLFNKKHSLFVTYDDEETFAYEAKYIKEQKLGGVMFWHLGQDDADSTLLKALHSGLNDGQNDDSKVSLEKGLRYEGKGPNQLPFIPATAWDPKTTYQKDQAVAFEGFVWRAKYYQDPGSKPSLKNTGWEMVGRVKEEKEEKK